MVELALYCRGRLSITPLGARGVVASRLPASEWVVASQGDKRGPGAHLSFERALTGVRVRGSARVRSATTRGVEIVAEPDAWREGIVLATPAMLHVGDTLLELVDPASPQRTQLVKLATLRSTSGPTDSGAPRSRQRWIRALESLHRWSATPAEAFATAIGLAIDPIGLDGAMVLRRTAGDSRGWEVAASSLVRPERGVWADLSVADRLVESPQTWFEPPQEAPTDGSIPHSDARPAHVVAPWFDAAGRLVGGLLGVRRVQPGEGPRGVPRSDADLVGLVAEALTAAMTQQTTTSRATRRRALVELSFAHADAAQRPVSRRSAA
ncbi:MAG: hypothetical protein ACRCT8_17570 [Lacipirellulaceae bacterium]